MKERQLHTALSQDEWSLAVTALKLRVPGGYGQYNLNKTFNF